MIFFRSDNFRRCSGLMYAARVIGFLIVITIISELQHQSTVIAVPNQTMTVTPTAVSGTTITASDENTRNNNISTPYNAHSHTDIASTTANVYTIGDNISGNKDYCEDSATDRCIRWNETAGLWTIQQNGTSYQQIVVSTGTVGLTNGTLLLGNGIGSIRNLGAMTNGQLAIGSTGADPVTATLTAGSNITVTNAAGAITIAAASTTAYTAGTFTRDTTLANGTQTVTFTGGTPKAIHFYCIQNGTREQSIGWSVGTAASGQMNIRDDESTADFYQIETTGQSIEDGETAGVRYAGAVTTLSSGSFVITWTRVSTPTGTLTCDFVEME